MIMLNTERKHFGILYLVAALLFFLPFTNVSAQSRRPIDSKHPMWIVHIDVWNTADPQKIIDLIPDDVKPFVCFNLSLSCQYDTERNVYKMPQNAILTYKSWASVCCANNVWFTCQPASGGHTHIMDDDLDTFEYFFKHYRNFLGWNFAEQFWGFDEPGDRSSSSQAARWELFANLVEMSHNYGGLLIVSFCGNIWSHPLNPNGIMKRNSKLLANCRKYPEAFLMLYKYTTSSCFYNNESVCLAPFISGLASNYGVRYDNCGWNGALDAILGENHGKKYPASVGFGTVMEQTCVNGGAVWDGPELIWTEDFQELGHTVSDGFTCRNWGRFANFDNGWLDMFRKIIDGTMYIPSREEVISQNRVVIVNNLSSGSDQDLYAAPDNLYDGLYKQDDPMNRGDGRWMDNMTYFKKTGRYRAVPVVCGLYDSLAKSIPLQVYRSAYSSKFGNVNTKVKEFNRLYPEISSGDLFVSRYRNQLVTYFPYSYFNRKKTASASIPLEYNSCDTLELVYGAFGNGIVREYPDHIDFYLNNFRSDTTSLVTDRITVSGAVAEPSCSMTLRAGAKGRTETSWDAVKGVFTVKVSHMGPVDITVECSGASVRTADDFIRLSPLADLPASPGEYFGDLIIEAEDMDYKAVSSCCTNPYYSNPDIRGHSGNGFIVTGTNPSAALRRKVSISRPGIYTVSVRYMNRGQSGRVNINVNGTVKSMYTVKTEFNGWTSVQYDFELKEGENVITVTNPGGTNMYIDQVVLSPSDKHTLVYDMASDSTRTTPDGKLLHLERGDYRLTFNAVGKHQNTDYTVVIVDTDGEEVMESRSYTASVTAPEECRYLFTVQRDGDYVIDFGCVSGNLADELDILSCQLNRTYLYNVRTVRTEGGEILADPAKAEAGDTIRLQADMDFGYSFVKWDVVRGGISIVDDMFVMPENDVTVQAIFKDNTLVWALDYQNVLAGTFPSGWRAVQGGNEEHCYPNSYGSGARVMSGFAGWQGKALYWREVSADYGRQSAYRLRLLPGLYRMTYVMAAWKNSPSYKARILSSSGAVVATSASVPAVPNASGNTSASLSSSPVRELVFRIVEEGNYIVEFRNAGSGFDEFLLVACRINRAEDPSGITVGRTEDSEGDETVYSVDGIITDRNRRGINVIRQSNGKSQKVLTR